LPGSGHGLEFFCIPSLNSFGPLLLFLFEQAAVAFLESALDALGLAFDLFHLDEQGVLDQGLLGSTRLEAALPVLFLALLELLLFLLYSLLPFLDLSDSLLRQFFL